MGEDEPLAYLRVLSGPPTGASRIGRVVTAPPAEARDSRRHSCTRHSRRRGAGRARRADLPHGVVRRLGFKVAGDEYLDDGILHTPMRLER